MQLDTCIVRVHSVGNAMHHSGCDTVGRLVAEAPPSTCLVGHGATGNTRNEHGASWRLPFAAVVSTLNWSAGGVKAWCLEIDYHVPFCSVSFIRARPAPTLSKLASLVPVLDIK
jgi:hypothetical protein